MKPTALITGGARRIGRSLALNLADKGYHIALHYNHSKVAAALLKSEIQDRWPALHVEIFKANLANINEVTLLIPQVLETMERLDVLINNASIFEPNTISATSPAFFDQQMAVNFKAPFFLIRDFARFVNHGNIVNMLDTQVNGNDSTFAAYLLAKKALLELTRMAALEFAPSIRVNAIAPGGVLPPKGKGDSYLEKLAQKTPLQRVGGMEPIIQSLNFLLLNSNLTGQVIYCDEGKHLTGFPYGG